MNSASDLISLPDIVTIGGKLCAMREPTEAEQQAVCSRHGFAWASQACADHFCDHAREATAELLALMFGVELGDALAFVDELTVRIQKLLLVDPVMLAKCEQMV